MLRGELIHPDIMAALALCGHGDKVLIADGNYPLDSKTGNAEKVYLGLRACLKSPRACLGGVFSALTALKILAIRQDACGFLPCRAKNPLANPYTSRY